PDFSYLRENSRKIVGVFLTHGHADAIGALPYFVSEFDVPVFGSELTIELAKIACENEEDARKFDDFHVIDESTEIDFENATISFFKLHILFQSLWVWLLKQKMEMLFILETLNLISLQKKVIEQIMQD